ncbi:hypothetical protein [Leucothrix arctica]|uniref:Uncharacterized protein n=1 Tax=Leucothrix arctica TaxID=1481894 RepID=A0A317C343_9GAMM|nr:hypothetical protein [Leucothrix arctica]PWQ93116.1 hypothetical protein DKT75_20725 [Leucothrix arctica]
MDKVKCKSCQSNVIPRLWVMNGGWFHYRRNQHLCVICGVVMYESGGEVAFERIWLVSGVVGLVIFGIGGAILVVAAYLLKGKIRKVLQGLEDKKEIKGKFLKYFDSLRSIKGKEK